MDGGARRAGCPQLAQLGDRVLSGRRRRCGFCFLARLRALAREIFEDGLQLVRRYLAIAAEHARHLAHQAAAI